MLLAVASASPSCVDKPLRIIDARPYINAQANALRGKGYENIGYLGGSSVASLAFMDIQNVSIVQSSIIEYHIILIMLYV